MARAKVIQQLFSDDLDGTQVPDPDELSRVVIGVDGVFYQLDMVRKNVTGFKTAVKKYITAAEKAQKDFESEGTDSIAYPNVIGTPEESAYDVVKGVYKLGLRGGGTSTGATTATPSKAIKELEEWAEGKFFHQNAKGVKRGVKVPTSSAGMKEFCIEMGEDISPTQKGRISAEVYLSALKTAEDKGIVGDGDPDA